MAFLLFVLSHLAVPAADVGATAPGEAAFEAEGVVTFKLDHFGEWSRIETNRFQVTSSGCQWRIKLTPVSPLPYDYREVAYDGQWIYSVACARTAFEAVMVKGPPGVSASNIATATISALAVPHGTFTHEAGAVWLALASGCYFSGLKSDQSDPAFTFGGPSWVHEDERAYSQKTTFLLQNEVLGLTRFDGHLGGRGAHGIYCVWVSKSTGLW